MKDLKEKIEWVLQNDPESRNSDIRLTLYIRRKFCGVGKTISLRDIFKLPREDHVKRIRAKFNEKGLYLPTDEVVRKRRKLQKKRGEFVKNI